MKHQKKGRILGRTKDGRKMLARAQANSLILKGRIITTEAKAKELRPFIEKLITRARIKNVSSRRILTTRIDNKKAVKKLIDEIAPKYIDRKGGYTRIVKLPVRKKDATKLALIEFV